VEEPVEEPMKSVDIVQVEIEGDAFFREEPLEKVYERNVLHDSNTPPVEPPSLISLIYSLNDASKAPSLNFDTNVVEIGTWMDWL